MARPGETRDDTIEIRLTLRNLLYRRLERLPLKLCRDVAPSGRDIDNPHRCEAPSNGSVVGQLRHSGTCDDLGD